MTYDTSADNFRVHFWHNGRDKGRISCALASYSEAERWIEDWKNEGERFANDDLRIHDLRSTGHVNDANIE